MTNARTHIPWVRASGMSCDITCAEGVGFEPTKRDYLLAVFKEAEGPLLTCIGAHMRSSETGGPDR